MLLRLTVFSLLTLGVLAQPSASPRNFEDENITGVDLAARLARTERISLEPNEQKSIELK